MSNVTLPKENALQNQAKAALTAATAIVPQAPQGAWGTEGVDAGDVLIPRLMLAHGLSQIVKDGGAKIGDIFNSNTGEVLAHLNEKKLCFVPVSYYREWHVLEVLRDGSRKPYERLRITDATENLTKEEAIQTADGRNILVERKKAHCFFVLLPQFADGLPFLLTFKGSNQMAGRRLVTHLKTSALKNEPAAATTWNLFSANHTYNNRTYPTFNVEPGEATPKALLDTAFKWYNQVRTASVVVAEDDGQD